MPLLLKHQKEREVNVKKIKFLIKVWLRKNTKRAVFYILPCFIVLLIGLSVATDFFQPQEMVGYDWLMRTRPTQSASPEIVIIEISDDTLKSLGWWPLPRDYHATLVKALTDSGCRMIVFDILLSEATEADSNLTDQIRNSGRVYLPYAFRMDKKTSRAQGIPVSGEILGGVADSFRSSVAGIGHINIFVDSDGKVRRMPLWIRHADRMWPSLGLLVAAKRLGYSPEKMQLRQGSLRLGGNIVIPLDSQGAFWINYPGPWIKTFRHFSYLDVLKGYVAQQNGSGSGLDLSVFKDKICFIGLTAAGTSDLRANPFDAVYPMVGTQASICDSFLRGVFIRRPHPLLRILISTVIFVLAIGVCLNFTPLLAFFYCILLASVYLAGAWSLFALRGFFLDLFLPLGGIALVYVVILLRKFFEEAQKRLILEKELEIAASIQRSFLPSDLSNLGGINIRTFLKPAKFVGGDLYDLIHIDESTFGFFIGDVSGKGVSAALIMAQAISLLRVIAKGHREPAQVLISLNNQLKPILNGLFVTAQYLVVHEKESYWQGASAGHLPLLYFNETQGSIQELLPASGPPLGLVENFSYTETKGQLERGDRILMYTDGWTETRNNKGQELGLKRFEEIFLNVRSETPKIILSNLESQQKVFQGRAPQHDDLTAVLLAF
jgi:serine phosphatase RsbU (regulator of sigma subunit)